MKKLLRIVGSTGLLAVLAWRVNLVAVGQSLARVRWDWWLAAALCYAFAQVVSSLRWQLLARPLGFRHRLRDHVGLYFVGTFFNLLLPTSVGGDAVRAWYLDRRSGRYWPALLTVLADRLSGLSVLLALTAGVSLALTEPPWVRWWAAGAGALALSGLAAFYLLPSGRGQVAPARGLRGKLRQLGEAAALYRGAPRRLLAVTGLSLVVQVVNIVLLGLLARGLGLGLPLPYLFAVVPLVSLLTLVPVSISGVGVREGALVVLLAPLGVAEETALALSVLWFSVFVAGGLAGAAWYLFGHFPRYEVKADDAPLGGDPGQGREGQPRAAA